ncbi:MAG TPA: beta-propeller fold lactonase family protein, partial [Ilumatobacteraceae bacterium]
LSDDGSITPSPVVLQGHGTGPVKDRQDGPHAHCARFCGSRLYWTDLGADRVLVCGYEPVRGVVEAPFEAFVAEPGDGPRHIAFHPTLPRAYLLTELSSRLIVLEVHADGRLTTLAGHSTLPAGFAGESIGGHLALNAADERLYVSNRGHDSISVFALDDAGDVALRQTIATGGRSPRHFRLVQEARVVIAAHEESDTITVLPLTDNGGLSEPVQQISCPGPVYIGAASLDTAW